MSQIQVDNIYNKEGTGSPNFPLGANVTGVITATTFKGGAEITSGTITAASGTFTGPVTIGGTLTYEDVTNIDSVGVITARSGVVDSTLTSGRILIAGASGRLTDNNNLKFDGSRLDIDSSAQNVLQINSTNSDGPSVPFQRSGSALAYLGSAAAAISGGTATDFSIRSEQNLVFASGGGSERLRIGSAGQIGLSGANYGTSGQVMTSQGASAAPQWATVAAGMTEIDEWYLSGDSGVAPDSDGVWWSSNVVRSTKANFSVKGTGMTYGTSDGIWTFPSTGYWEVTNHMNGRAFHPSNSRYINHYWMFTTNNSTYNIIFTQTLNGETAPNTNGTYLGFNWSKTHIFRITDASNQKMRQGFMHNYGAGWGLLGAAQTASTGNGNGACNWIFKKLADV